METSKNMFFVEKMLQMGKIYKLLTDAFPLADCVSYKQRESLAQQSTNQIDLAVL